MASTKKAAKLASRKRAAAAEETAVSDLVPVTDGHRLVFDGQGRTTCGQRASDKGWRYGTVEDLTCVDCGAAIPDVPPGQFEADAVLAELGVES